MTQVEAEVVRTYRWKADIKGDYRGTSGSISRSLKLSDGLRKS